MRFISILSILIPILTLASACGSKSDDADDPHRKATAAECQQAYEHYAELDAVKRGSTKDDELKLQQGNIEHCPKMTSKAGIDCMVALPKADMMALHDCETKK